MISQTHNPHRRALVATAALVVAVVATMAYSTLAQLYDERQDHVGAAAELMREQSYALGEHLAKNVESADIVSDALESLSAEHGLGDGTLHFGASELGWVDDHVGLNRPVAAVGIYDRAGALRHHLGIRTATPSNAADRSAFRILENSATEHLAETPQIDPATGHWSIAIWGRVTGPGGRFLGGVRTVVEPVEAYRLYSQPWGAGAVVAVTDGEGRILMIRPPAGVDSATLVGQPLRGLTAFHDLPADALGGEGQRTLDNGKVAVVISHLTDLPLAIVVARTYDDILREWRDEFIYDCAPVVGAALLGVALMAIAWYYGRQRQRVEAALEQSRAEIETLYDTAPVGLTLLDRDLRYVRINQKMHEISGALADRDIGRTVREVVPQVADQVEPIYRKILETGEPVVNVPVTLPLSPDTGEMRHFLSSYHPVLDRHGRPVGINAVIQDVTELKRMHEHSLAPDVGASRRRRTSSASPTPSVARHIINEAGRRMIGIGDDEDTRHLRVPDFYSEASRKTFVEEVRPQSTANGTWQGELTMVSRDGREIPVQQTIIAHRDDQGVANFYAIFIRDMSKEKRAEEALLRREERFRALIENASDLISVIDTKGNITFQSPSSQMLGYAPEELVGHNFAEFVHPDDLITCQQVIAELSVDIGGIGIGGIPRARQERRLACAPGRRSQRNAPPSRQGHRHQRARRDRNPQG